MLVVMTLAMPLTVSGFVVAPEFQAEVIIGDQCHHRDEEKIYEQIQCRIFFGKQSRREQT